MSALITHTQTDFMMEKTEHSSLNEWVCPRFRGTIIQFPLSCVCVLVLAAINEASYLISVFAGL